MKKILIAVAILVLCYPLFHVAMFGYEYNELFRDLIICCSVSAFLFMIGRFLRRIEVLEREVEELKDCLLKYTKFE